MSVIVGVSGYELTADDIALLTSPLVTGVILFTRNYKDPAQLQALTNSIKKLRPELAIGADQEGGRVQRFKASFTKLPAFGDIGQVWQDNPEAAKKMAYASGYVMAYELSRYNVDFSFTPVLDLDRKLNNVIGNRSFGADPELISVLGLEMCRAIAEVGMLRIGKHFPGHGGVKIDTHFAVAHDKRTRDEINQDIKPFEELMKQQMLTGIMPAHVIYDEIDESPAGFSEVWLQKILKEELQFDGTVFSDCLTMAGAKMDGGISAAAIKALHAGCDYVLICNNLPEIPAVLKKLVDAGVQPKPLILTPLSGSETIYKEQLDILKC